MGKKNWTYALQGMNDEDDCYYIGTTSKLFTRLKNHNEKSGSKFTKTWYNVEKLLGIYKGRSEGILTRHTNYGGNQLGETLPAHDYDLENELTLNNMFYKEGIIRGGDYIKGNDDIYKYKDKMKNFIPTIPLCECGEICDIFEINNNLYYKCVKNNCWDGLKKFCYENNILFDSDCCNFSVKINDYKFIDYSIECIDCYKKDNFGKKYNRKYCTECFKEKNKYLSKNNAKIRGYYEKDGKCSKCQKKKYDPLYYNNSYWTICNDCFYDGREPLEKQLRFLVSNDVDSKLANCH